MKRGLRTLAFTIACAFVCLLGAVAKDTSTADSQLARRLTSPNGHERQVAHSSLRAQRRDTIDALLAAARSASADPRLDYAKVEAIETLGRYRASEACGYLVEEIEYHAPVFVLSPHPLNGYPAAQSLVRIGNPAIEAILDRLGKRATDKQLRISAFVIELVDGKELGLARLEIALARAEARLAKGSLSAATERENLTRLVHLFRSIDFRDPKESPSLGKRAE